MQLQSPTLHSYTQRIIAKDPNQMPCGDYIEAPENRLIELGQETQSSGANPSKSSANLKRCIPPEQKIIRRATREEGGSEDSPRGEEEDREGRRLRGRVWEEGLRVQNGPLYRSGGN
jgi:hypothetical protein